MWKPRTWFLGSADWGDEPSQSWQQQDTQVHSTLPHFLCSLKGPCRRDAEAPLLGQAAIPGRAASLAAFPLLALCRFLKDGFGMCQNDPFQHATGLHSSMAHEESC